MIRRRFLAALMGQAASPTSTLDPEATRKILALEKPWDQFIRQYFGCRPTGETTAETCRPALSAWNVGEFGRARQAARQLFEL